MMVVLRRLYFSLSIKVTITAVIVLAVSVPTKVIIIITKSDIELVPSVLGKILIIIKYTTKRASVPAAPPIIPLKSLKKKSENVRGRFSCSILVLVRLLRQIIDLSVHRGTDDHLRFQRGQIIDPS